MLKLRGLQNQATDTLKKMEKLAIQVNQQNSWEGFSQNGYQQHFLYLLGATKVLTSPSLDTIQAVDIPTSSTIILAVHGSDV